MAEEVAALDDEPRQEGDFAVQTGDIDEACRLGREALGCAVGQVIQPNVHDVLSLRRLLQPGATQRWSATSTPA
jgi:hypothetical protein